MSVDKFRIVKDETALIVIDIQEKLFVAMEEKIQYTVERNSGILIEAAKIFNLPILVSEQYRKGLGPTLSSLFEKLDNYTVKEKLYFDCLKDQELNSHIKEIDKKCFIIIGIESHVCVFQTALSLLEMGKRVIIACDAVASRRKQDWFMAMESLRQAGCLIYPTETIAFMMLEKAGTPEFKKMAPLFK